MHAASQVLAAGANFVLLGPEATMLPATVPVVAVCAVRTGCGKSQTTRYIARPAEAARVCASVAVRHPMPYGDLVAERVQRFATLAGPRHGAASRSRSGRSTSRTSATARSSTRASTTARSSSEAQQECDVLLWDGGNNDLPFYRPDVHITVVDPLRAGHERRTTRVRRTSGWPTSSWSTRSDVADARSDRRGGARRSAT